MFLSQDNFENRVSFVHFGKFLHEGVLILVCSWEHALTKWFRVCDISPRQRFTEVKELKLQKFVQVVEAASCKNLQGKAAYIDYKSSEDENGILFLDLRMCLICDDVCICWCKEMKIETILTNSVHSKRYLSSRRLKRG
jgi:hypothetical protein